MLCNKENRKALISLGMSIFRGNLVIATIREVTASGGSALRIAEALNSTTFKLLQILAKERLDVTTISKRLELSEAYISEQVRLLEDLKLISISYERGKRGIRKVCDLAIEKITLIITDQLPISL